MKEQQLAESLKLEMLKEKELELSLTREKIKEQALEKTLKRGKKKEKVRFLSSPSSLSLPLFLCPLPLSLNPSSSIPLLLGSPVLHASHPKQGIF